MTIKDLDKDEWVKKYNLDLTKMPEDRYEDLFNPEKAEIYND